MTSIVWLSYPWPQREAVPVEKWGRDHWTTLAYVETRCVDEKGVLNGDHLRCSLSRHPDLRGYQQVVSDLDGDKYPTRLKKGELLENHDDWSCLEDMMILGMLVVEITEHQTGRGQIRGSRVTLTDYGWEIAGRLRKFKGEGGNYGDFDPGVNG